MLVKVYTRFHSHFQWDRQAQMFRNVHIPLVHAAYESNNRHGEEKEGEPGEREAEGTSCTSSFQDLECPRPWGRPWGRFVEGNDSSLGDQYRSVLNLQVI